MFWLYLFPFVGTAAGRLEGDSVVLRQRERPSSTGRRCGSLTALIEAGKFHGEVLNVGCGEAAISLYLAARGPHESSWEAVAGFGRTILPAGDREKIVYGNAERLLRI